jgi:hypothetical protein
MEIPFVDLYFQYFPIKNEIDNAIHSVIKDSAFISGKYVQEGIFLDDKKLNTLFHVQMVLILLK